MATVKVEDHGGHALVFMETTIIYDNTIIRSCVGETKQYTRNGINVYWVARYVPLVGSNVVMEFEAKGEALAWLTTVARME